MLTRKGVDGLLRRIMETGGMTEDMEKDVERLRAEFDEREGILKKYGEEWDGESEEFDWKEKPIEDYSGPYKELEEKYRSLVGRYNNKFFAGGDAHAGDSAFVDVSISEPDTKIKSIFKEV